MATDGSRRDQAGTPGLIAKSGSSVQAEQSQVLSELDRAVISALQRDGRMAIVDLAAEVHASPRTVRKRIGELLENRAIEITTVCDPSILGYRAGALLGVKTKPGRPRAEIAEELLDMPAVDYAVVTTGRYDIVVEILCENEQRLNEAIDQSIYPNPHFLDVEVYPYLKLHYQQPVWELAQSKDEPKERVDREAAPRELDEIDIDILRELNADGRVPFSHLADQLNVSESLIRKRFARLTDAGSVRVMALVNPKALGFETTVWLAIKVDSGASMVKLADDLSRLPSVAYLVTCAGRFDIFAEVVCRDRRDLVSIIENHVRPLEEINRLEILLCHDLYYRRVMPAL